MTSDAARWLFKTFGLAPSPDRYQLDLADGRIVALRRNFDTLGLLAALLSNNQSRA